MISAWPFGALQPLAYDLIMVDPPWAHIGWSPKGVTRKSAGGQYDLMSIDDIKALPLASLARRDALLWLWGTHAMIDQQIECCRAWGFRFSTTGVWVKRTRHGKLAFGTGKRLRCASEPFIIGTIGAPVTARNVRTVVEGPTREHSRKPDEAYAAAERLHPRALRRADIFSRESRPGWEPFGFETGKFDQTENAA